MMLNSWPILADFTLDQLHKELAWCNAIRQPQIPDRAAYRAAVVRELLRRDGAK